MKNKPDRKFFLLMMIVGPLLLVSGCDNKTSDGETVGQKIDKVIEQANEKTQKAGDKLSDTSKTTEQAAKETAENVQKKAGDVGVVLEDSAITAAVKAELLREPGVSALKIDVNTVKGEVTLNGEANSQAARTRAGEIAAAVDGVIKVNNAISVKRKS